MDIDDVISGEGAISSSPPIATTPLPSLLSRTLPVPYLFDSTTLSSDPLTQNTFDYRSTKRPSTTTQSGPAKKTQRPDSGLNTQPADLVLQARSLLVKACHLEKSFDKQSQLLNLLEVFRQYTESGINPTTTSSKVLTSQVAHLKQVTRKLTDFIAKQNSHFYSKIDKLYANR